MFKAPTRRNSLAQLSTSAPERELPVSPSKPGSSPNTKDTMKLLGMLRLNTESTASGSYDDQNVVGNNDDFAGFDWVNPQWTPLSSPTKKTPQTSPTKKSPLKEVQSSSNSTQSTAVEVKAKRSLVF